MGLIRLQVAGNAMCLQDITKGKYIKEEKYVKEQSEAQNTDLGASKV